jgi:hypothetical protein
MPTLPVSQQRASPAMGRPVLYSRSSEQEFSLDVLNVSAGIVRV